VAGPARERNTGLDTTIARKGLTIRRAARTFPRARQPAPAGPMSWLELLAVVMSLASVALTVRRHVACWPTGIVGVAAYFALFVDQKLYADSALQIVFLAQNAYGWWYWLHGTGATGERPVGVLGARARAGVVVATAVVAVLVGAGLRRWTDAALPWADAALSTTSLVANWLLARKLIENWWLWLAADVGYVVVFWSKGLHLSAALYVVFFGLCVVGVREWSASRRAALSA
jgi:nicotinamide mononucleotide transporter